MFLAWNETVREWRGDNEDDDNWQVLKQVKSDGENESQLARWRSKPFMAFKKKTLKNRC